jgi:DNA-directed RNA polymerase specialized sigma24 family protein
MRNPDEFDAFYKDARARLLLQTYALTGDLPASRAAVRDSFVVAWHHWRKISRLDDPESWARPHAWAHAQRRHTARLWHREKGLDPEDRATLDALGKLPVTQRKTLLLTQLTTVSMAGMAREVGLPAPEAERELQTATAQFAVHRDVPTTSIRTLFEGLRRHVETTRWPRPTIVRRAGAARRRTHTAAGAVAAVAALVVTGSLVTDAAGVRPTLDRETVTTHTHRDGRAGPAAQASVAKPAELPPDAMLAPEQVAAYVDGRRWTARAVSDNTTGDGLVMPCQRARYADPRGNTALVRTFATTQPPPRAGRKATPEAAQRAAKVTAAQATEVSRTPRTALRTFDTTLDWYAGCLDERVQLLSTHRVDRVGDEAMLLVLRDWDRPTRTIVVGVARTGRLTTTTTTRLPGVVDPDARSFARLLGTAVDGLCHLPAGGACARGPRLREVAPPPVGEVPGMLAEVDLPPVPGVDQPWVGTQPRRATSNVAATRCDHADFASAPMTNNLTRSFVVPGARLNDQFGLTETVGSLPAHRAQAFVQQVRSRIAACPDKVLGTEVTPMRQVRTGRTDLSVWRVRTEISDQSSVVFLMGIARSGTSVAQVGFVPDGRVTMGSDAFVALVSRALDRLTAMPPPRNG